jgi:hypothetical protein
VTTVDVYIEESTALSRSRFTAASMRTGHDGPACPYPGIPGWHPYRSVASSYIETTAPGAIIRSVLAHVDEQDLEFRPGDSARLSAFRARR